MPLVSYTIDNPPSARASHADEAAFAAACRIAVPPLGLDGSVQPGVPRGTITKFRHTGLSVFPGVARDVSLYVPAQYDAAKPANLMVCQDARFYLADNFNVPLMFDNLIARGDMPVTIGLFAEPGDLAGEAPGSFGNRSFEYDSLTDAYSRLLHDELLPIIARDYNISPDPADRASMGMSSGGICAFNLAWHRPDSFGRVVSHVGSFTNIRGGNAYPSLVRKTDPSRSARFCRAPRTISTRPMAIGLSPISTWPPPCSSRAMIIASSSVRVVTTANMARRSFRKPCAGCGDSVDGHPAR